MKQKTKIGAKVVADSLDTRGNRLTSFLITMPRIILSEINTHRMLSKNTSSSRAIPFHKMVEAVNNDPFIPIAWQKEHKGMQGTEYIDDNISSNTVEDESALYSIHRDWFDARDYALEQAERLNRNKLTKQLCNRLLEPFMWTTMLITGSKEGWENFFNLRSPEYHLENVPTVNEDLSLNSKTLTLVGKSKKELLKQINKIDNDSYTGFKTIINNYSDLDWLKLNKGQAEIHMMQLAECIYDAMQESTPKQLKVGEWHIPFEDKIQIAEDIGTKEQVYETKVKISTAMAARTSYTVVENEKEIDYSKIIELHDRLLSQDPPHSSPMEHCARAMSEIEYTGSKKTGYSTIKGGQDDGKGYGWCNNLKGFIPYRYFIDNKIEL